MSESLITCLVTTSPSPGHPDTGIIEGTVASLRWHLPDCEILIACDGVRPEQENRRASYSEFVLRMEELCLTKWKDVRLIVQPDFLHQAWTIAKAIEQIKTTLILFTEHDQSLIPAPIPWESLCERVRCGQVNLVRFMLEDKIKPEWNDFMLGFMEPYSELMKTIQWSQRTHLAAMPYYRWMIQKHLLPGDRCYLEDRLYGQCDAWEDHKLTIFYPGNPRRIFHLDARGGEPKFDSVLEGKE